MDEEDLVDLVPVGSVWGLNPTAVASTKFCRHGTPVVITGKDGENRSYAYVGGGCRGMRPCVPKRWRQVDDFLACLVRIGEARRPDEPLPWHLEMQEKIKAQLVQGLPPRRR